MNDERLNQYQNQNSLDIAAKEFVEKDNQYTQDIDNLRNEQSGLTQEHDRITGELQAIDDPQNEWAKYDELSKKSQQVFDERERVTQSLKTKEAEQDAFKKDYHAKANQANVQEVSNIDEDKGKNYENLTGKKLDTNVGFENQTNDLNKNIDSNTADQAKDAVSNDDRLNQWQEQANEQQNEQVHENDLGNDRMSGGMQQEEPER
jgi:hypothetical protein